VVTGQKKVNQGKELANVEGLMDEIDMNLDFARRRLVLEEKQAVKKQKVQVKERVNWLAMEQEAQRKEREMQMKQDKLRREQEYERTKGQLIIKRIDGIISEQDLNLQLLKMDMPEELPDGPLRDFQK